MSYFNRQKHSDITLTLDDGLTKVTIYAHRVILANKSLFFDGLFDFHPEQKEFVLSIGQYQISVNEALKIIEEQIYRGLPVTFDQIQNYSHFLNSLLIDNKTYNREFMTTTRFIVKECSASKRMIVLLDVTSKIGTLTFETDPATKRLILTVDKYLCRNDEFLDYLLMLTSDLSEEEIDRIKKEGHVIDTTHEIQNLIKGLYSSNYIVDNGHPYSNILAKSLFDQYFDVVDPIYRRTKELSGIKLDIETFKVMGVMMISFGFRILESAGPSTPFLSINITIKRKETEISYSCNKVILNEHPKFFLIEEWLKIFTPLDPIEDVTSKLGYTIPTIAKLNNRDTKDLAVISAIISYMYASNVLPVVNTWEHPNTQEELAVLKQLIGLDITNEYSIDNR